MLLETLTCMDSEVIFDAEQHGRIDAHNTFLV